MNGLSEQRCFNHVDREAVARCTQCRSFFCRECVVDHDQRLLCAACLSGATDQRDNSKRKWSLIRPIVFVLSCLVLWSALYIFGRTLLILPDSFHEGTIWSVNQTSIVEEEE